MFFHLIPKRKKKKKKKLSPMKYSHHSTQAGKKKKITRNFFFSRVEHCKSLFTTQGKSFTQEKENSPSSIFFSLLPFNSTQEKKKKFRMKKY